MHQFIRIWQDIPPQTWIAVLGAGGVSVLTQLLKKLAKLENARVIQVLFAAVAFAASGLQYLTSNHSLPPTVLGLHTAVLVGLGSQWYAHIISPLNKALVAAKTANPEQLANELSAAVPDGTTSGAYMSTANPSPVTTSETIAGF